jgi:hypothetical protein
MRRIFHGSVPAFDASRIPPAAGHRIERYDKLTRAATGALSVILFDVSSQMGFHQWRQRDNAHFRACYSQELNNHCIKNMSEDIDRKIAGLEKELAGLRRLKLAALQSEVAALQASLGDAEAGGPRRRRRRGRPGRKPKGWAAAGAAAAPAQAVRRRGRGRKRGKRLTEADAVALLTKAVASAGSAGISARQASVAARVFYPRAIKLMAANFKKRGSGKWTRYTLR